MQPLLSNHSLAAYPTTWIEICSDCCQISQRISEDVPQTLERCRNIRIMDSIMDSMVPVALMFPAGSIRACKVVEDPLLRLTDSLGRFYSRTGLTELNLASKRVKMVNYGELFVYWLVVSTLTSYFWPQEVFGIIIDK